MINVIKVQSECIKKLVKGEKVNWCKFDDGVWVTTDGYICYSIPKSQFFLDLSTKVPMNALRDIRENFANAKAIKATTEMKYSSSYNAIKFITADGEEHWLQEKFAKLCDSWLFYKSVFYGLNNGMLVVMVMETRVKTDSV